MKTPLIALLYAALTLGANQGFTQEISSELRAELLEMREGNMRKLKCKPSRRGRSSRRLPIRRGKT